MRCFAGFLSFLLGGVVADDGAEGRDDLRNG